MHDTCRYPQTNPSGLSHAHRLVEMHFNGITTLVKDLAADKTNGCWQQKDNYHFSASWLKAQQLSEVLAACMARSCKETNTSASTGNRWMCTSDARETKIKLKQRHCQGQSCGALHKISSQSQQKGPRPMMPEMAHQIHKPRHAWTRTRCRGGRGGGTFQ